MSTFADAFNSGNKLVAGAARSVIHDVANGDDATGSLNALAFELVRWSKSQAPSQRLTNAEVALADIAIRP